MLSLIGRVTNPLVQKPSAVVEFLPQIWNLNIKATGEDSRHSHSSLDILISPKNWDKIRFFVSARDVDLARVCVQINGLEPLEFKMSILLPTGEVTIVELEYEKLEKHCVLCSSRFHEKADCPLLDPSTI